MLGGKYVPPDVALRGCWLKVSGLSQVSARSDEQTATPRSSTGFPAMHGAPGPDHLAVTLGCTVYSVSRTILCAVNVKGTPGWEEGTGLSVCIRAG